MHRINLRDDLGSLRIENVIISVWGQTEFFLQHLAPCSLRFGVAVFELVSPKMAICWEVIIINETWVFSAWHNCIPFQQVNHGWLQYGVIRGWQGKLEEIMQQCMGLIKTDLRFRVLNVMFSFVLQWCTKTHRLSNICINSMCSTTARSSSRMDYISSISAELCCRNLTDK